MKRKLIFFNCMRDTKHLERAPQNTKTWHRTKMWLAYLAEVLCQQYNITLAREKQWYEENGKNEIINK